MYRYGKAVGANGVPNKIVRKFFNLLVKAINLSGRARKVASLLCHAQGKFPFYWGKFDA